MFRDREDAARQLAKKFEGRPLDKPLVLAIPRGGVVIGAVLADEIGADLDLALSRKLRAPDQPELAIGAVSEEGRVYLNRHGRELLAQSEDYIVAERQRQLAELARRQRVYRAVCPAAPVKGRTVIVTDDGIATGATMLAALQTIKSEKPRELLVAVPVAHPDRLQEFRPWCDEVICLHWPAEFYSISQFYEDFMQVDDNEVLALLKAHASRGQAPAAAKT